MGKVRIVTDSSAHFPRPETARHYNIYVVPLLIHLGSQAFREGVDLEAEDFFRLLERSNIRATLSAPSVEDFTAVYQRLHRETDQILSLHMSRRMSKAWEHARAASQTLLGRCDIAVVDSRTTSVGLAILVELAARMAEQGASLDEIVHVVRATLPHVYSVFYVNSLTYLRYNGLLSEAQTILGTMLNIKPFLTIEEGELIPMEKVRTQSQALDKLMEFVSEFTAPERLVILDSSFYPSEHARQIHERLSLEFPDHAISTVLYGPSLATLIGPDGMGVVVHENPDPAEDEE